MRVLIVAARFPQAGGKGDQQRALQLAQLLAPDHHVTVATPARAPSPADRAELERVAELHPIVAGPARRLAGALGAVLHGLPLQVGWMMPAAASREVAAVAARADVVIAITIRCLRGRLPAPTVLDHIDPLSLNMRERARLERRAPLRAAALVEAWLLSRHERRAARWVAAQTVVSALDAAALPDRPRPVVLPLVLELEPSARNNADDRDIDVIMTGDMRYPPNRDGAEWLAAEIVPALRRRTGDVRVVVAGRAARTLPGMTGVELLSDVDDVGALIRRSRVAVIPLRRGTGTPIKLLEAAGGGAAPVSTPWVATALGVDIDTAGDATAFAAAIDRLLADEPLRLRRVQAARDGLSHHARAAVAEQLLALLQQVGAA